MKAIVIGAGGATGKFLVEELLNTATYSLVTIFVRKPSFDAHPKLKQVVVIRRIVNTFLIKRHLK